MDEVLPTQAASLEREQVHKPEAPSVGLPLTVNLVMTGLVNLSCLVMTPKLLTPEHAFEVLLILPPVPIVWGVYLLCRYRTFPVNVASYLAGLCAAWWVTYAIACVRVGLR